MKHMCRDCQWFTGLVRRALVAGGVWHGFCQWYPEDQWHRPWWNNARQLVGREVPADHLSGCRTYKPDKEINP